MIESIKGRTNDFIVLPDGQIIASCFLVIIMQGIHDIGQYRIVQEDKRQILVQFTKGREFDPRTPERIKEEIRKVIGSTLEVKVEILEELGRDESGKIRTVVSKVIPGMQERMSL
jgi:phenylacetate-CoA ligase